MSDSVETVRMPSTMNEDMTTPSNEHPTTVQAESPKHGLPGIIWVALAVVVIVLLAVIASVTTLLCLRER